MFDLLLSIENSGDAPFSFTGALHTYLRVADVGDVRGARFAGGALLRQGRETRQRARDRARVARRPAARSHLLHARPKTSRCSSAITAWRYAPAALRIRWCGNPGEAGGAGIADLEAGGYARMVCVEAAAARRPISVAAGEFWRGGQMLAARG
jgi:glucose-6-phosphate 1-epimerase